MKKFKLKALVARTRKVKDGAVGNEAEGGEVVQDFGHLPQCLWELLNVLSRRMATIC